MSLPDVKVMVKALDALEFKDRFQCPIVVARPDKEDTAYSGVD